MILQTILLLIGCYLLGSVPSAYIAARLLKGEDIRRYGSGNVGGSNVWQTVSRWAMVPVGIADVGKGSVAVIAAQGLGFGLPVQMGAGLATVAGHNWSIFLRFNGGRGIGTGIGVLLLLAPRELVGFTIIALIGLIFRNVPLGVGAGMFAVPFISWWLGAPAPIVIGTSLMVVLLILKRLTSNRGTGAESGDWKAIIINRLLFDRDIRSREAWINRVPTGARRQEDAKGHPPPAEAEPDKLPR